MKVNIKKYLDNKKKHYYLEDITGAKVKIDIGKIRSRGAVSTSFSKFLNFANDKEFTAKLDVENGYTKMYVLEEDDSPVKWLFHIEDLIVVG